MKLLSYFLLILIAAAGCTGKSRKTGGNTENQPADTGKAVITFAEYEHAFGKVKEGEKVGCIFSFSNTGTGNLVINSATTTCGCTVPKYDTKPIAPGKSGRLEVIFNTEGRNGLQTKTITVKSNAKTPVALLKITAEVLMNEK